MATPNPEEQKKSKWLPAAVVQRVRGALKSEDASDELEKKSKVLVQDEEEKILETVLKENSALQAKNTSLTKRLADQEKKVKTSNSQLVKCKEEIQQLKLSKKAQSVPARVEKTDRDKKERSYQRQYYNLQHISKERDELVTEVSRLDEENRKLRESLDLLTQRNSDYSMEIKELSGKVQHLKVDLQTELEDNTRLRADIKQLQQEFKSLLSNNAGTAANLDGGEDQSSITIWRLKSRIKQLDEDMAKVREHSKSQSRQVLFLRQQAEAAKYWQEQLQSLDVMLREAEEERDDLRAKLLQIAAQDNESDITESHQDTGQDGIAEFPRKPAQSGNQKGTLMPTSSKDSVIQDPTKSNQSLQVKLQSLEEEKQHLLSQLESLQLQVTSYKSDFDDERRDRERAHSKMADMEKQLAELKDRTDHDKACFQHEIGELKRDKQALHDKLQHEDEELNRHKAILADLDVVHQKHVEEASKASKKFSDLKVQAEAATSELQAKTSQMKLYAKENDKLKEDVQLLKLQVSAAVASMKAMAEEVSKERKTTVKLQRKLEETKAKEVKVGRKISLPDPSEAIEKRADKLEESLDIAMQEIQELTCENEHLLGEIQSLTVLNDELSDQMQTMRQTQQRLGKLLEQQHGEISSVIRPQCVTISAENEKLRDEVSQMKAANKKSGMATIASSSENTKNMLDMVTKQGDQLKKQNEQLTKQIDWLKKKGEVSPDLPPEDDPTLLEIEFAHQRADDANKRTDTATAKAMEAERRAKEAEQQAKAAGMKHLEAEAHNIAVEKKLDETCIQLQKMNSEIERLKMENEQLCLQHIPSSVPQFAHMVQVMPISKQSKNQSDGECKSSEMVSPLAHPNQPDANLDHKESRTTHLEKRLDKMLLDMQTISAENEKLRDEVSQVKAANKKSGMATIASSSELGAPQQYKEIHVLGKDDAQKPTKELPPLRLRSRTSPPITRERSRSPSPVAIVKPMSQSPNPQAPYQWQANVGSIMIRAIPSAYSMSPPLPHAHYYNQQQQQQQINSVENDKIGEGTEFIDNPQTLKPNLVEEHDDRPYDPNLVCPTCRKQFRIGEIQEYRKHYKICHMKRSEESIQLIPARHNMAGGTQPFTPIPPSMGCQSGINKDTQAAEPKVLCRTPGCSFKGYEDLGGLCPDCHGNIQDDLV